MSTTAAAVLPRPRVGRGHAYARHYWAFTVPAALVVLLVILFPWIFTIFMSLHDWKVTGDTPFVGLANYTKMLHDERAYKVLEELNTAPSIVYLERTNV